MFLSGESVSKSSMLGQVALRLVQGLQHVLLRSFISVQLQYNCVSEAVIFPVIIFCCSDCPLVQFQGIVTIPIFRSD
jgi:hypothetical protein